MTTMTAANLKPHSPSHRLVSRALIFSVALGCAVAGAQPQPGRGPDREAEGRRDSDQRRDGSGSRDSNGRNNNGRDNNGRDPNSRGAENRDHHNHRDNSRREGGQHIEAGRWHDGAHGNNRFYPRPGWAVTGPPARSRVVVWGGVHYRYHDSVWYAPGHRGYVVVRPPYGVVIADRPAFFTLLTIGTVAYLYANGVYYREHSAGYEVVPPPVEGASTVPPAPTYVYPRQAQSAQQQATDEYECHRWAVSQTGFDPAGTATGQTIRSNPVQRDNYQRATHACLEGRGYTVR